MKQADNSSLTDKEFRDLAWRTTDTIMRLSSARGAMELRFVEFFKDRYGRLPRTEDRANFNELLAVEMVERAHAKAESRRYKKRKPVVSVCTGRDATKREILLLVWEVSLAHIHQANKRKAIKWHFEEEFISEHNCRPSDWEFHKLKEHLDENVLEWLRDRIAVTRPKAEKVLEQVAQGECRLFRRRPALEHWKKSLEAPTKAAR